MNKEDDQFDRFLPKEQRDKDNLFVDIPAQQTPIRPERVPPGFEPMGEIYLRGRAFRGLTTGQVAWWILMTGWIIFGAIAGLLLHILLSASPWMALLALAIAVIPLFILLKGTRAKLVHQRGQRR